MLNRQKPVRTLTLMAAGTGLRISECLGLQWQDVSFAGAIIQCASYLDVWPSGFAKNQNFKGPSAAPSVAGRIHVFLETEDFVLAARRLGLCFRSAKRPTATCCEHAGRRLSAASCSEGWTESSHRIATNMGEWWRMIRAGSDFTTFATGWRRFWFVSEPTLRPSRHCFVTATLN